MSTRIAIGFVALAIAGAAASVRAQTLGIGDPAAEARSQVVRQGRARQGVRAGQELRRRVLGDLVRSLRTSIPHLTELQKKHPDVTFIGVSVFESDQAARRAVRQGDGRQDGLSRGHRRRPRRARAEATVPWPRPGWRPPDRTGIPTAFIVNKEGKIAWIGHPMEHGEAAREDRRRTLGSQDSR